MTTLQRVEGLSPRLKQHVQGVRTFIRDYAETNLLIRGEESSDRIIAFHTFDFISDFNMSPPASAISLEEMYARGWSSMCIRGTLNSLLSGLVLQYTRNSLPFSDGGISVNMNDKAGALMQYQNLVLTTYEQTKAKVKTAMNVEQLLGDESYGLFSDLGFLESVYGY